MNAAGLGWVALGGAIGSVARALASVLIPTGRLPWATLVVNVVGSLLIGWLVATLAPLGEEKLATHHFWVVGVCGGFTTFSTFSWQTFEQFQRGHWGLAVANILLSVILCLVATWLGWRLAR